MGAKLTLFYQITASYAKKYKCNKRFLTCINYFKYVMKMTFLQYIFSITVMFVFRICNMAFCVQRSSVFPIK